MIDYARMQRVFPSQKAALTRARKIEDTKHRLLAVLEACEKAVEVWDEIGAWPDDWARWARALDDAYYARVQDGDVTPGIQHRISVLRRAGL